MPKVIGYTPAWLSKPSPGAQVFSDPEPQSPASPSKRSSYFGSNAPPQQTFDKTRRLIANRGTEVFTVVGNKIRWADLSRVKDEWDERNHGQKSQVDRKAYRTLVTPVYYQITELIISPSGIFLAICTEHTIHIAVLPDSSRLKDNDQPPLKLKTFQLGPTTHVIPESPLASVRWHPLAASTSSTDCLVTVTTEAAVRIWEIDRSSHWSFEQPALSIDLRKLADGVSSDEDFTPSTFGKNRGFSVDAFEMEASAACFGGQGTPDEDAWASMTLWVAMSNGDVYALCPLLPSRWMPTPTTIPALSISAVSLVATLTEHDLQTDERKAAEQQYEWVQEIDKEGPIATAGGSDRDLDEIMHRPSNPSAIPRLQGPFELSGIDDLEEGEITDIHVIASRLDEEALLSGEDDYEMISEGIQFTTICLGTTTNKILLSLELEGVSGQWLPKKGRSTFSVPTSEARNLVLLESLDCGATTSGPASNVWPLFTPELNNIYNFFAVAGGHIRSFSLSDWASRVGIELSGDGDADAGLQTRLVMACQTTICVTQSILTIESNTSAGSDLSAPIIIHDVNLGDMLVTHVNGQAQAALFDVDSFRLSQSLSSLPSNTLMSPPKHGRNALNTIGEEELPEPVPTRAPYTPADLLYRNQMQPYEELKHRIPASRRSVLTDTPLRLSPACLDIMTLAHRTFSAQTSNIEKAAAELFRRCERLREELTDQVKQMSELADRLQHIGGGSESHSGEKQTFEDRTSKAQARQRNLVQRYEKLRRRTGRIGTANQELSAKEEVWIEEIHTLDRTTQASDQVTSTDNLSKRYEIVSLPCDKQPF